MDGFARLAAVGERRSFNQGDRLMKQGDAAHSLFVILSGRVSVVREHKDLATPVHLAFLSSGEVVGEMGLLDGEPRSATVSAIEPTLVMEVPQEQLAKVVEENPEVFAELAKVLSRRLRNTDATAAQIASRPRS